MSQPPPDPSSGSSLDPSPSRTPAETADPSGVDLDEALRPRTSRRRRAVQVGGVLVVLLVVVGALLRGVAPAVPSSASSSLRVTPTPPFSVLILSNVSFGVLDVNGRTLSDSPPLLVSNPFHAGTNVVTLTASPFRARSCTIDWFSGQVVQSTGCDASDQRSGSSYRLHGMVVTPDAAVDFNMDSSDLPSDLAAQAYRTVVQALAAASLHMVIPSGQYYAVGMDRQGHIIARRATTPLEAEVDFRIPDPQNGPTGSTGPCSGAMLCAFPLDPGTALPTGQRLWSVYTFLAVSWGYTSLTGAVTVSPRLLSNTSTQLFLTYDPSRGSWSAFAQPSPVGSTGTSGGTGPGLPTLSGQLQSCLCLIGFSLVDALSQDHPGVGADTSQTQSDAGCVIQFLTADSSAVQGTFLWRFGVLLAVDKGAHTVAPWLPLAPQAEIAAVGG